MFNIQKICQEIKGFLKKNKQMYEISGVSKSPKKSVTSAIKKGVNIFGENRVLEAKIKFDGIKEQFSNIDSFNWTLQIKQSQRSSGFI